MNYNLGYLAGLIDGEGTFTIRFSTFFVETLQKERLRFWGEISIVNTNYNIILLCKKAMDEQGIKYTEVIKKPSDKIKPVTVLRIYQKESLKKICNLLSGKIGKQNELNILSEFLSLTGKTQCYVDNERLKRIFDLRTELIDIHGKHSKKFSKYFKYENFVLSEEDINKLEEMKISRVKKMHKARGLEV
jgi:hypothetical protein